MWETSGNIKIRRDSGTHSVYPRSCWGGIELRPNFQKGWAWQDLNFYREVTGKEEGVIFFQGRCSFYVKNELKSEVFKDKKKFLMFFTVITKNLNWEILTKNLATFKRYDEDEKFEYYGGSPKNRFLGGFHEKPSRYCQVLIFRNF